MSDPTSGHDGTADGGRRVDDVNGLAESERSAFRDAPGVAAVVGPSGVITAVNTAWSDAARAHGAPGRCGVGTDYVRVCRVGMRQHAPGAARAFRDVTAVLADRRSHAASVYPFAGPDGLRWFRSEVFALGDRQGVGVRHLDLTDSQPAPSLHLARAAASPQGLHPDDADTFHDGLDELLQAPTTDGHLLVLVAAVREPDLERQTTARALAHLVIERTAGELVGNPAHVDIVAPLSEVDVGVVVSAPSLSDAMRVADRLRGAAARLLPARPAWGLAVAARPDQDATALVGLARQAAQDVGHRRHLVADAARAPEDDRHADLHRCARRLTDAVAEFDLALESGVPLPDLVLRDVEVTHAENACLAAAARLRTIGW